MKKNNGLRSCKNKNRRPIGGRKLEDETGKTRREEGRNRKIKKKREKILEIKNDFSVNTYVV